MDGADTLATVAAPLGAIAAAAAFVLWDVVAYDRRRRPAPVRRRAPRRVRVVAAPAQARPAQRRPAEARPAEVRPAPPADDSMLGALTTTDEDVRSPLRRVVSLLVLLTLTLATAGLIGAAIYQGLSRISGD